MVPRSTPKAWKKVEVPNWSTVWRCDCQWSKHTRIVAARLRFWARLYRRSNHLSRRELVNLCKVCLLWKFAAFWRLGFRSKRIDVDGMPYRKLRIQRYDLLDLDKYFDSYEETSGYTTIPFEQIYPDSALQVDCKTMRNGSQASQFSNHERYYWTILSSIFSMTQKLMHGNHDSLTVWWRKRAKFLKNFAVLQEKRLKGQSQRLLHRSRQLMCIMRQRR